MAKKSKKRKKADRIRINQRRAQKNRRAAPVAPVTPTTNSLETMVDSHARSTTPVKETSTKKKKDLKEYWPVTAFAAAFASLIVGGPYLLSRATTIYEGAINTPGVARVEAREVWVISDPGFNSMHYEGNVVKVYMDDGREGSIRDYNGDFRINGKDYVSGDARFEPKLILKETLKEAMKIKKSTKNYRFIRS